MLKELKEKKDRLEEVSGSLVMAQLPQGCPPKVGTQEPDLSLPWQLGITNITSEKMVEDMTIKDEFSTPLIITIITLAGSLLLVAAIYGCHQRFSQKKDQVRWPGGWER